MTNSRFDEQADCANEAGPYSDLEVANLDHLRDGIEVTNIERLRNETLLPTRVHAADAASREGLEAYHPNVPKDSQGLIVVNERNFPDDEKATAATPKRWTRKRILIWSAVAVFATIVIVVAGVVGGTLSRNRHSSSSSSGATPSSPSWLDAEPTSPSVGLPVETGRYTVSLPQVQRNSVCIAEQAALNVTWQCMDSFSVGLSFTQNSDGINVVFNDYSLNVKDMEYGPQPPDFNGTQLNLHTVTDTQDPSLGPALYFNVTFDKLVIVSESKLNKSGNSNSSTSTSNTLQIGDRPFFCYWNSTLAEYFVYAENDQMTTLTQGSNPPTYIGKVKYIEKRPPSEALQPYCQPMQILDNWQVVPIANQAPITIRELFPQSGLLSSFCSCEWFNG